MTISSFGKESTNTGNVYMLKEKHTLNRELINSVCFANLWCWSRNSNTLATECVELTHWKRPWCWERLKAGGEGDDRGWDDWMASLTQWTWIWVNSGSWWWTGRPGVLESMGSQRFGHDWATEMNWTELNCWCTLLDVNNEPRSF